MISNIDEDSNSPSKRDREVIRKGDKNIMKLLKRIDKSTINFVEKQRKLRLE
jgi:hypothetical protein